MHPFGMPNDKQLDARALVTWQQAGVVELADVELPCGPDDFELTFKAWLGYVKGPFLPFVATWVAAIGQYRSVPVSAASLKALRAMMRRDVDESAGILWDATPAVVAAWVGWYPKWVAAQIQERSNIDPWFLAPAEAYYRHRQLQRTRDTQAGQQVQRDVKLGADLFNHLERHGGMARWHPGLLAKKISTRGRGKRVDVRKVAEMGAALVRVGVARWKRAPSGKAWAMELTEHTLKH